MKTFLMLLLLNIFMGPALAEVRDNCYSNLSSLIEESDRLRAFRQSKKYKEHEFAGSILGKSDFAKLEDGAYIYIIDQAGEIYFSPRFNLNSQTQNILATHGSLFNKFIKGNRRKRVYAAGEFYLRAGAVSEFNNKSGKFRGDQQHLEYAIQLFTKNNFEIDPQILRNYAKEEEVIINHSHEEAVAKYFDQIQSNDILLDKFNLLREQYRLLYQKFPGQKPGQIDPQKIKKVFLEEIYRDNIDDGVEVAFQVIYFTSYTYKDQGGLIYSFYNMLVSEQLDIVLLNNAKLINF